MLQLIDQAWFLMAFIGALAGFFGLAGLLAEMALHLHRRQRVQRRQAVQIREPSWNT